MNTAIAIRIFTPFALGYYLSYLYRSINAIMAPEIVADIGIDAADLGFVASAFFLTFAAFQLPLGVLLDRFGPRKTESFLLIFAALGALVYAFADSTIGLFIGQGLIGLGVSACLMGSFKAFVVWFPKDKLPLTNGLILAAGGLGALTATTPIETALHFTDWRGVFMALAGVSVLVAAIVWFVIPERPAEKIKPTDETIVQQFKAIGKIFASPVYFQIVPLVVTTQATALAIEGLWAGPWFRDIAGYDRAAVAESLLIIAASLLAGFLLTGIIAERLARIGLNVVTTSVIGMMIFCGAQALIVFDLMPAIMPVWIVFAFFGTSSALVFAGLSQRFPSHMAGRLITAINVLVFTGAFATQWGIGAIIDIWPASAGGHFAAAGYRAAFGVMLALQLASAAWFWIARLIWPAPKDV